MGLERARVGSTWLQRRSTIGAGGLLASRRGRPVSGSTGQGHILKHACSHPHPAVIELLLDLAERGFRMRDPPFAHPAHDFRSQAMPNLLINGTTHSLLLHTAYNDGYLTTRRTFRHTPVITDE